MDRSPSRNARFLLVAIAFVMAFALTTGVAHAASTYFDQYPAVGGVCAEPMPKISVKVSDPAGINTGYQMKIDGVSKTPKVTWGPGSSYCMLSYQVTSPLSNGTHTVYASVYTGAGRTSTTWTFTERNAPQLGPLSPADGSTVNSQKPTISAVVNTNGATLASYSMKVDGASVSPTYDSATKTISYTPFSRLTNDRDHTAELTVTDGTGASTTVSWHFHVQIYVSMVDTQGCTTCHASYPTTHPMTNCWGCHAANGPFSAYWNMDNMQQYAHGADYLVGIDCAYCHSSQFADVPRHPADLDVTHQTTTDMSGCSCHVSELTIEHNRYTDPETGEPKVTCASCHEPTDPKVAAAMEAGSRFCVDCHEIPAGHPYASIDHVADVGEVTDTSGVKCGACHDMDLMTEHEKATSTSAGQACSNCHDTPRDTFVSWNQTCSQGGCHAVGTAQAMHGDMASKHTPDANTCSGVGCHTFTDVSALHSEATTTVAGVTYTSCTVCHRSGATPTKTCSDCHEGHGDITAAHTYTGMSPDCQASGCHVNTLPEAHATAIGPGTSFPDAETTCVVCHGNPAVGDITTKTPECGSCHTDMHGDIVVIHTPADPASEACAAAGCHDTSNAMTIHASRVEGKCAVCHANPTKGDMTAGKSSAACNGCHATEKVDYHTGMDTAHQASVSDYETCGQCHHGWGNPLVGPSLTRHNNCGECHNATFDLSDKTAHCSSCHTTEGAGGSAPTYFHRSTAAIHSPQDAASLDCARCHETTNVRVLHEGTTNGCGTCHVTKTCTECHTMHNADPGTTLLRNVSCTRCHNTVGTNYHKDFSATHTYSSMDASCQGSGCHSNALVTAHQAYVGAGGRYPQYTDTCALCHLNADPDRIPAGATSACSSCHTIHPDLTEAHTAAPAAEPITILGTNTGSHACSECHASMDLRTIHGGSSSCVTCHPQPVDSLAGSYNNGCAQGGCHTSGTSAQHAGADAAHTISVSVTCTSGCHGDTNNLAALHSTESTVVGGVTRTSCQICHAAGATLTSNCATCHNMTNPHPTVAHQGVSTSGFISAGMDNSDHYPGDGDYTECSSCHITQLLPLHVNNCAACHSSTNPNVVGAIAAGNGQCVACHPSQHSWESIGAHEDEYNSGNYDCGGCHGYGCTQCHGPHTPNAVPTTTSDAKSAYEGDARITLTASDGDTGAFGIRATYYVLDGTPAVKGTLISVPAPSAGSASHTLKFWSVDWSGNTELSQTVAFTVSKDTVAPTTTSDLKASYVGPATITLSATDGSQAGVQDTYYSLDGGTATKGTTLTVPQPASGTASHTLSFWSVDKSGNTESPKGGSFTITADTVAPTTVMTNSRYYRSVYPYFYFTTTDPAPSSANLSYYVLLDGSAANVYGKWPTSNGNWYTYLYAGTGTHTLSYWAKDNAGNVGSVETTTIVYDATGPTTTSNALSSYTGTATITLTANDNVGGSGVNQTYYRYYNSTTGTWYGWYTGTTATLPPRASGSYTYNLYYYSTDNAGNSGATGSKTGIIVNAAGPDVTAPTGTMSINNNAAYTGSTSVTVNSAVTDNVGVTQMCVDPATGTYGSWVPYSSTYSITLPTGSGSKVVRVQYRDAAGNVLTLSDPIVLDVTGPTGTMSINNGANYTNFTSATINSSVTDAHSGLTQMSVDPGTGTFGSWIAYAATYPVTLTGTDGTKTVRVQYRDTMGNVTTLTDTIVLDATAPYTTVNINPGQNYTGSQTFTLTPTDGAGSGVTGTWWQLDSSTGSWTSGTSVPVVAPASGKAAHRLYWYSQDVAGNRETTKSVDFSVSAPVGNAYTSQLRLDGTAWTDAELGSTGAWGTYSIYLDGVLIGTKPANATSTWACPQTMVTGAGVITITYETGFTNAGFIWDYSGPQTYGFQLPAGTSVLNASIWTGFGDVRVADDWYDGYDSDYTYAAIDPATIKGISYVTATNDTSAPSGSLDLNWGGTYTTGTYVYVIPSASDAGGTGVSEMRFSNDNVNWTGWQDYTANAQSWTVPTGDGVKRVYVQYRDGAGNVSASFSDTILLDASAPTGSVTINAGAATTNSTAVTLSLSASDGAGLGVWQMRFSNNNSTWSAWESYATTKSWNLTTGDGTKTVYVQFRDSAYQQSGSYTDTITLQAPDSTPPTGSVSVNSGANYTGTTAVTLALSATDASSGMSQMRFSNDNSTWSAWETYATSKSWILTTGDGTKTVYVQYKDVAGNASTSYSDTIVLETVAPTGTISVNAAAAYTNNTAVTLTLSASDAAAGMGKMRFSNDNSAWSAWENYATTQSWTLASGDGAKTVYVQYQDAVGNTSTSYSDGITLDGTAPATTSNAVGSDTYTGAQSFALSASDSGSGVSGTWWQLDSTTGSWTSGTAVSVAAPASGTASHTLYWYSRDVANNTETTKSVTFSVSAPLGNTYVSSMRLDGTAWTDAEYGASGAWGSYSIYLDGTLLGTKQADGTSWVCPATPVNGAGVIRIEYDTSFAGSPFIWDASGAQSATLQLPAGTTQLNAGIWSGFSTVRTGDDWYDGYDSDYTYSVVDATTIKGISYVTTATDTTAPTGSVSINNGGSYATGTYVYLYAGASDAGGTGVSEMRFSNDNATWGSWQDYSANATGWTLATGDGTKTVYVQFRDAAGNTSPSYSDTILLDATGPSGSVTINAGAATTNSTAVTLTLSASDGAGLGVYQMRFSNNGSTWSGWETYATTKNWTLTAGDGTKTVYVQFRDSAYWPSSSVTDTITLQTVDTTAPTGSMSVNSGATYTGSTAATVNSAVTDNVGVTQMSIDPGTGTYGSWITYAASSAITLPSGSGVKTVRVQYKDAAGNILTLSDTITLDVTEPTGTMSVNSGAASTSSLSATVNSSVSDAGSGISQMSVDPGTGTYGSWISYAAAHPITLPVGDGVKTVRVQYRDALGNVMTLTDTIVVDTVAPTSSSNVTSGQTYMGAQNFTLSATDSGTGVAGTWWQLDATTGSWTSGTAVTVAAPSSGTQSHTLYFYSKDSANNTEPTKSVSFSVAAVTAPSSQTFAFTGAAQTFTVPAGVTSLDVDLYGAQGGDAADGAGGLGGRVQATIPVTPGQVLTLKVGGTGGWDGSGSAAGGWPNGGAGGYCGAGGGGSTSILAAGSVLVEAGAGGGGDHDPIDGGQGGAQGTGAGGNADGGYGNGDGAGGGGGWNGGYGGSEHDSAGTGGTSFIAVGNGTLTPGVRSGNGALTVSWSTATPVTLTASLPYDSRHADMWLEIWDDTTNVMLASNFVEEGHDLEVSVLGVPGHQFSMNASWSIYDYDGGGDGSDSYTVPASAAVSGGTVTHSFAW